jgi:hypothetical protein
MVCGELGGFTTYIFFSMKRKGVRTYSGCVQTNHQLKCTARPNSSPTVDADKATAITMAAMVSAMSK